MKPKAHKETSKKHMAFFQEKIIIKQFQRSIILLENERDEPDSDYARVMKGGKQFCHEMLTGGSI